MPDTKKFSDTFNLLMSTPATDSSSDAIMSQAARQQSFIESDTLPVYMSPKDHKILETAGVVFGDVVNGDELFQYVQLPPGWRKSKTEHPMHNDLLDEKGRKRAAIFYKATNYRNADLSCIRRFSINVDYDKVDEGIAKAVVMDCGVEIFCSSSVSFDPQGVNQLRLDAQHTVFEEAKMWLVERYPYWQNTAMYWD